MEKHPKAPSWRIVGTDAEGTFCHKPCTVSGGGKSEISKAIDDAVIYGPLFVNDMEKSMQKVKEIAVLYPVNSFSNDSFISFKFKNVFFLLTNLDTEEHN